MPTGAGKKYFYIITYWMKWAVYRKNPALALAHASTRVPRQEIWVRVGVRHRSAQKVFKTYE